jgi:hypothetical protein
MSCEKKPNFDLEKELHISERELMLYQRFRPDFRLSHKTTRDFLLNELKSLSELSLPSENCRVVMSITRRDLTFDQHVTAADLVRPNGVDAAYYVQNIPNLLLENENRAYRLSMRLWCFDISNDDTQDQDFDDEEENYDPMLWWRGYSYENMLERYERLSIDYPSANPRIGSPDEFLSLIARARIEGVCHMSKEFPMKRGWAIVSASRIWAGHHLRAPIVVSTAKGKIRINVQRYGKREGDGMPISFGRI